MAQEGIQRPREEAGERGSADKRSEIDSELALAVRKDDYARAKTLLEAKANPKFFSLPEEPEPGEKPSSPLLIAVAQNNSKIVKLLIDHKADLYQLGKHDDDALFTAITSQKPLMVDTLLDLGVRVNRNVNQWTPLTWAAYQLVAATSDSAKNIANQIIVKLIRVGAKVDYSHDRIRYLYPASKYHPYIANLLLDSAIRDRWLNLAVKLIENKADYRVKPREDAGDSDLGRFVSFLIKENKIARFWEATRHANPEVRKLFQDAICKDGGAIRSAAKHGQANLVDALIKANADPSAKTRFEDETPLLFAVKNGHTDTVRVLLEHNANLERHLSSRDFLYVAAMAGHVDIMKLLLKKNPSFHYPIMLYDCLSQAVEYGHDEAARLLLQTLAAMHPSYPAPAQLSEEYDKALLQGHMPIVDALIQTNINFNRGEEPPLIWQAGQIQRQLARIEQLVEKKVDLANQGKPLVQMIKHGGHAVVIEKLLEHKANINECDSDGSSLLIVAAKYNRLNIVKLLLDKKADINQVNKENQNAWMCALNNPRIKRLLEMHGAKPFLAALCPRAGAGSTLKELEQKSSIFEPKVLKFALKFAGVGGSKGTAIDFSFWSKDPSPSSSSSSSSSPVIPQPHGDAESESLAPEEPSSAARTGI